MKKVVVTLTVAEALALSTAIGNWTTDPELCAELYPDKGKAVMRGHTKLDAAIGAVGGFAPKPPKGKR